MALQEASQARIRLKIKIMESFLSELACIVYSRMQQFWKLDRWVRVTDIEGNASFKEIGQEVLSNDFDLKVMAGSTMPVNRNAMMDLMIRLAQTNGEDGLPLVDRKAVLEFLPTGDKKAISDRFEQLKAQQQQEQQMLAEQQNAQMQQQQGEMNQSVTQEVMNMLQQVISASDMTAKQVDELIMDKENREKKEYESSIEEKGYKRGVKDGQMQIKKEEKEIGDKDAKANDVPNNDNAVSDYNENIEPTGAEVGQIPTEVLQELLTIAQEQPELFQEIIVNYPELAEMLQQDINVMNGGNM